MFFLLQVKAKVEEFKEHMPLVQTLFNPGLRERHWEKISDIVGFNIQPADTSCLSKFVDMNLDPYIPKFESISEAASKEFALEKALEGMKKEWAPVSEISFMLKSLLCFTESSIVSMKLIYHINLICGREQQNQC